MKRTALATMAVAVVVCLGGFGSTAASAQATKPATTTPTTPQAPRKFVPPVKGTAEIGILKPVVKFDNKTNEVVTTIKLRNLSMGAIAGLRVDEFWFDKRGGMLPGDSKRLKQPLYPGEVATIELRTPRNPKMDRNSYQFSHANGQVRTKQLTKID
jgi:hypothetical protein